MTQHQAGWSNLAVIGFVTTTIFVMNLMNSANNISHSSVNVFLSPKPKAFPTRAPPSLPRFGYRRVTNETVVWISMGLCFTKNTNLWGKKNYPYSEVLPLSVLLWLHFYPPSVKVILFLIRSKDDMQVRVDNYDKMLKALAKDGGHEDRVLIRWVDTGDMDCVTRSQTERMWAFDDPGVRDTDLVVTIDANAFVYNASSLNPVYNNPEKLIWVFQYQDTAAIPTDIGETFNQNFIVAYADVWRTIVDPGRSPNMKIGQEWINASVIEIGLDRVSGQSKWYYDQWITTYGIIKNGLCTVPKESGLWNVPGLKERGIFHPFYDDSAFCWHGKHHKDCNKMIHIVPYGCKWWHFFPEAEFPEHLNKFHELTNNTYAFNLTDIWGQKV